MCTGCKGLRQELRDLETAYRRFKKAKDIEKAFACIQLLYKETKNREYTVDFRRWLYGFHADEKILNFQKQCYAMSGRDYFPDYMIAMEWNRMWEQKFYLPREDALKPLALEMQKLVDDELDLLCISAPPGIGKTGLGDFFLTFVTGRNPELANLMGSHSNSILNDNYNECLRMMTSDEYCWKDIFPEHKVVKTNAADLKIDVDTAKKFSSLQYGSISGSLAGRVRAVGLLFLDDLIPNLETALSRERLDKIWGQYTTDYRQRKQGKCKELHIATRWSVWDVIGRLERANENNPRAKFIALPAMDETDHSNFNYGGDIGFTTKMYREIRRDMDEVTWRCLYMNEPIEREGLLFPKEELQYYLELPAEEPDAVIAVVDTKDHGADDCVMPVAYRYGDKYYIECLMCDPGTPDVTVPKIASLLKEHKVHQCRFESNAAGGQIARDVDKQLKALGGQTSITTKYSTANKETRIIVQSAWIKSHCLFKDKDIQSQEYRKAMNLLCGFSQVSKKKKDDVPDALSMLADFANSFETNVITIRQRLF